MSEPYYETTGPDATFVRNDIFNKLKHYENDESGLSLLKIKEIIENHIPETMTNFGSFRGYASFGLDPDIYRRILKDINILKDVKKQSEIDEHKHDGDGDNLIC